MLAIADRALGTARWSAHKSGRLELRLIDVVDLPGPPGAALAMIGASAAGEQDRYLIPLRVGSDGMREAGEDDPLWTELGALMEAGGRMLGGRTELIAEPAHRMESPPVYHRARSSGTEQSNTVVIVDEQVAVKCYRRLEQGPTPDVELRCYLQDRGFSHVPSLRGWLTWHEPGAGSWMVAHSSDYVVQAPTFWRLLREGAQAALAGRAGQAGIAKPLRELGHVVARMHVLLADARPNELGHTPVGTGEGRRWRSQARAQLAWAREHGEADVRRELDVVAARLEREFERFAEVPARTLRIHGDLHVGQVLRTSAGPVLLDFDGQPGTSLRARRRPASPMRDLASLTRSIDHSCREGAQMAGVAPEVAHLELAGYIAAAHERVLEGYLAEPGACELFDAQLLRAFAFACTIYEFRYAAQYLPGWEYAPRWALRGLLESSPST